MTKIKKGGGIEINPHIFRDYDIRGIYPIEINEKVYYILGRAIAAYFHSSPIAVGYDTRLSSKKLFKALTHGIRDQGTDVIDLGLISTEMHYFASGYYQFPANIIISASHNPPEYNGLKIVKKNAVPIHGLSGIPEIKTLVFKQKFIESKKYGSMEKKDILDDWIKHALKFVEVKKLKKLKVVVDSGNGMGGISWQKIIKRLPVQIIPKFFTPNGKFPNHLPDPLDEKNLTVLKEEIIKERADLGFALDGDADRLFVVDNQGQTLSGSISTAILAEYLLKKHGPSTVLYSITCGRIVPETIEKSHGLPQPVRVGHSFIKTEMRKRNALFAGEHSGHFYFRDNFDADSSLIAGLLFLEYMSQENKPLSTIRKKFEKYYSSGEINFIIKNPQNVIDYFVDQYQDQQKSTLDGLSVYFPNWWFNIRLSKTEPLVRLNLEAESAKTLKLELATLSETIKKMGGIIKH